MSSGIGMQCEGTDQFCRITQHGSHPAGALGEAPPKWYSDGPLTLLSWYAEVEFDDDGWRYRIRFDANGKTGDGWRGLGYRYHVSAMELGWLQDDPRIPGTEYGPWELVDHCPTDGEERIPASL